MNNSEVSLSNEVRQEIDNSGNMEKKGYTSGMFKFICGFISYAMGIILLLLACVSFEDSILSGILLIMAAVLCLPFVRKVIRKKVNIKGIVFLLFIVVLVFVALLSVPESVESKEGGSEQAEISDIQSEYVETNGGNEYVNNDVTNVPTKIPEKEEDKISNATSPLYMKINGKQYCIADLNMQVIGDIFPNGQFDEEEKTWKDEDNNYSVTYSEISGDVEMVLLSSNIGSIYKGICVGMDKQDIIDILGEADESKDGTKFVWYYDETGKETNEESSYVYSIIIYFENEKARIVGVMNTEPMFDGMYIYLGVEYLSGLFEWNDDEISVYVDDVKCTTMTWDDVRIILLPFDRRTHTIKIYRNALMKKEMTFSHNQCEKFTDEAYGVWFDYRYSGIQGEDSLESAEFHTTYLEDYSFLNTPEMWLILIEGESIVFKEWLEMTE